jgi:hypothetical protein
MGWFFRKSFRLLSGVKLNLSKSGPRLSLGVPRARASIDIDGKTRIYGGVGPLRYQKTVTVGPSHNPQAKRSGLLDVIRGFLGR